ncbi:MAG: hypothetical protein KDM91_02890 [Verrucomicrobiae bacterium]|nr:hypothetical protein [Verrucomicrobiae bacterium]MCP5539274.1 hypothetical protein [Akkermansiaceae bacterium]
MSRHRRRAASPVFAVLTAAVLLNSCASRVHRLDLSTYPQLPMPISTKAMRRSLEIDPLMKHIAVYGNYGGPGGWGGPPVDGVDEAFRVHDIAYTQHSKLRDLREADRRLIADLKAVDPRSLDSNGQRFRRHAIFYMRSPFGFLSKPLYSWLGLPPWDVVIDTGDPDGAPASEGG